ncbi:MAG: hypothetical protein IPK50_15795 [Fibrobacterota bacterium]|nr:hypothetical protein [Fibrobacterota bacterium]QQS03754.1 MAG: hypothetical protein IPK50_15795 [Fibrobacterota bacterium]
MQILPDDDLEIIHEEDPAELPMVMARILAGLKGTAEIDSMDPKGVAVRTPREMIEHIGKMLSQPG